MKGPEGPILLAEYERKGQKDYVMINKPYLSSYSLNYNWIYDFLLNIQIFLSILYTNTWIHLKLYSSFHNPRLQNRLKNIYI